MPLPTSRPASRPASLPRPLRAPAARRWTTGLAAATLALGPAQAVLAPPARATTAATAVAAATVSQQYADQAFPAAGVRVDDNDQTSPTQDKPQSKLWCAGGSWWALMRSASGPITIHQLVGHAWQDTGTVVDARPTSTGDALYADGELVVASRTIDGDLRVVRLSSGGGAWTAEGGAATVATGGFESATLARDSTGRLWVTFTQGARVYVAHTTASAATWGAPFLVPHADTSVSTDDISAVTAFDGKVGVMWSDQVSQAVRFAVHVDGAADDAWTTETPLSGTRMADDHLNLRPTPDGRVLAAVKTSLGDSASDPLTGPGILVLTRSTGGAWSRAVVSTVADKLTRPQLALDTTDRRVHVLASTEAGGSVYEKSSPLDDVSFAPGKGNVLITYPGAAINNVTTTRDPVTAATGLVVLASDEKKTLRYYHAEVPLGAGQAQDTTAPSVPTGLAASATSPTSVTLTWRASGDDTAVAGYRVVRGTTVVAAGTTATSFTDTGLAAGTGYSYTVSAVDAAGNRSEESVPATVTTPSATAADLPARLQGPDRYATAVDVSRRAFPFGAPTAVVASGAAFPDALAAAPLAHAAGGPLLLVEPGAVPAAVSGELDRLGVRRVLVVGGTSAVSGGVSQALAAPGRTVVRVQGADRYATAAAVAAAARAAGATSPEVVVASGERFPDALAGGASAAARGAVLLLTRPGDVPADTRAALEDEAPGSITVLGGPAAVSPQVVTDLGPLATGAVTRVFGADRYATAAAVTERTGAHPDAVLLASGTGFPDALAGAALGLPLELSTPSCLPPATADSLARLGSPRVVALGGTAALSDAAARGTRC